MMHPRYHLPVKQKRETWISPGAWVPWNTAKQDRDITLCLRELFSVGFTLSKSELTHRRKWSEGFRLGGQGKPESAKNCKIGTIWSQKTSEKTHNSRTNVSHTFWTQCSSNLMSTRGFPEVDRSTTWQQEEIVKECKYFTTGLMDGEDNGSTIVWKASQCFQNKEGCRTARKEDKLS